MKAGKLKLAAFLGTSLLLSGTFAAGRADPTDAALERRIPDTKFESTPFSETIDYLRDIGGINLHVNWAALEAAGIDKSVPLTFRLRNASARKVLETILREAGAGNKLAYEVDDGMLEISTQEEMDKHLVTAVYDIKDLMFQPLNAGDPPDLQFQLEPVTRGGGGGSGSDIFGGTGGGANTSQNQTPEQKGQAIVDLIQSMIRPEIWDKAGGPGSIRYFNGALIVSAPKSVQALIGPAVHE